MQGIPYYIAQKKASSNIKTEMYFFVIFTFLRNFAMETHPHAAYVAEHDATRNSCTAGIAHTVTNTPYYIYIIQQKPTKQ